jgi:hypothetical protein
MISFPPEISSSLPPRYGFEGFRAEPFCFPVPPEKEESILRALCVSVVKMNAVKKELKSSEDSLEFFLRGDVAQMGERCVRNAQVEGSNPFISTRNNKGFMISCFMNPFLFVFTHKMALMRAVRRHNGCSP